MLATAKKTTLIERFRTHDTDTGSPEVQIAILSERIGELTEHFKTHKKDHASVWALPAQCLLSCYFRSPSLAMTSR